MNDGRENLARAINDLNQILGSMERILHNTDYQPYINKGYPKQQIDGLEDVIEDVGTQVDFVEKALKQEAESEPDPDPDPDQTALDAKVERLLPKVYQAMRERGLKTMPMGDSIDLAREIAEKDNEK